MDDIITQKLLEFASPQILLSVADDVSGGQLEELTDFVDYTLFFLGACSKAANTEPPRWVIVPPGFYEAYHIQASYEMVNAGTRDVVRHYEDYLLLIVPYPFNDGHYLEYQLLD